MVDIFSDNVHDGLRTGVIRGHSSNIGTTYQSVSNGVGYIIPQLSEATSLAIASTDVTDTSGGLGARTVLIMGLDSDYAEISEFVTLNGQTKVPLVNQYIAINSMVVTSSGIGTDELDAYVNKGDVSIGLASDDFTGGSPSVIYHQIEALWTTSACGFLTVPKGRVVNIDNIKFSTNGTKNLLVLVQARRRDGTRAVLAEIHVTQGAQELTHLIGSNLLRYGDHIRMIARVESGQAGGALTSIITYTLGLD